MSMNQLLTRLNSPTLVSSVGVSVLASAPYFMKLLMTSDTITFSTLQALNVASFALNVIAVSVPGRIDGQEDTNMRQSTLTGVSQPLVTPPPVTTTERSNDDSSTYTHLYSPERSRSLITPSGWAFAIWGPIYLGEALFCLGGQFFLFEPTQQATFAAITASFTAANILQSLWCASFRPSYYNSSDHWTKFVSVGFLGGTAYSLSQIFTTANASLIMPWYWCLPLVMHFGWTTAATLVNLNGSIAAIPNVSEKVVIASGHTSSILATGLGIYLTAFQMIPPPYGLTLAWALTACATGIKKKQLASDSTQTDTMKRAMGVQARLCQGGALLCVLASVSAFDLF